MSVVTIDPNSAPYEELLQMNPTDPEVRRRMTLFEIRRQPAPRCPLCGGVMKIMSKRIDDGSRFWGCELWKLGCKGKIEIDLA